MYKTRNAGDHTRAQLLRGEGVLAGAPEALQLLHACGIPHVFLTNGGGVLESAKAAQLADALGVPVAPEQVIVSHSPMRPLAEKYAGQKVLVLGWRDVKGVAEAYGFAPVVTVDCLASHDPTAYPFMSWPDKRLPPSVADAPFGAVLIMHDPVHWAPDLQLALDVLRGGDPLGSGNRQAVPLYASNPDFVFAGRHPVPRFAQGAFTQTLSFLFKQLTGQDLAITQYGKPHAVTFDFALARLQAQAGGPPLQRVYMVGDNPKADIRGANWAGDPWRSLLVSTGVHGAPREAFTSPALQGGSHQELLRSTPSLAADGAGNDVTDPASAVVAGVLDAVVAGLQAGAVDAER